VSKKKLRLTKKVFDWFRIERDRWHWINRNMFKRLMVIDKSGYAKYVSAITNYNLCSCLTHEITLVENADNDYDIIVKYNRNPRVLRDLGLFWRIYDHIDCYGFISLYQIEKYVKKYEFAIYPSPVDRYAKYRRNALRVIGKNKGRNRNGI
jgi:hypothetical protein